MTISKELCLFRLGRLCKVKDIPAGVEISSGPDKNFQLEVGFIFQQGEENRQNSIKICTILLNLYNTILGYL